MWSHGAGYVWRALTLPQPAIAQEPWDNPPCQTRSPIPAARSAFANNPELGMRPLMERVLSRREILGA